ncbi:MAG TPA: replicative DNA helicase, partial [Cytophagales bacterium]|nr:replicative DNA helicase [Cytophagales bacterium]
FLYRPEYYGILEDEEKNSTKGIGEVIIAKHRNGSLDTIKLRFIGQFTKFADLENDFGSNDGMSSFNSFPSSSSDGPEFMRLPSKLNDNFNKSDDFDLGKNFPTDDEAPF